MAAEPAGFEDIRREGYQRFAQAVVGAYVRMVPVLLGFCLVLAWLERLWWRRYALFGVVAALLWFTFLERRRVTTPSDRPLLPGFAQVGSMVGMILIIGPMTGGILSPFATQLAYSAVLWSFAATGGISLAAVLIAGAAIWGSMVVALYGNYFMPSAFVDAGGRLSPVFYVSEAAMFSAALYLGRDAGRALRHMGDDMLRRSLSMRDEMLQLHADRARELTTLSGEIAHELKNPLASLKGLTSLIALDPGRAVERAAVMKGEIERMQAILQDFLNFARPLVPLQVEDTDLRELAGEVIYLHEGLALARGVALTIEPGEPLALPCDPRKVKQVLVNLVQNALDASAQGGPVSIAFGIDGAYGWVQVRDRGLGLAAALGPVGDGGPQAGATTKAHGSGIGLTIVRALAEQHGGRFRLANRQGGGCSAELSLPLSSPAG
jgi:two-component system sensor histidine kinase HydH